MDIFGNPNFRSELASQLKTAREADRKEKYIVNRGGGEYLHKLEGLRYLFEYVRTLTAKKVLDVGAGHTLGTHQLSKMPWAKGLDFEATSLQFFSPEIRKNLGVSKTHITSVERLKGTKDKPITPGSYAAVLAVLSLAYSEHPELAISNIDSILVPGGAIKSRFADYAYKSQGLKIFSKDMFEKILKSKGYDVYSHKIYDSSVLLALKPGANINAKELFYSDFDSYDEQIKEWDVKIRKGRKSKI